MSARRRSGRVWSHDRGRSVTKARRAQFIDAAILWDRTKNDDVVRLVGLGYHVVRVGKGDDELA